MIKEYFKEWNKFEIYLVLIGILSSIIVGIYFNSPIVAVGYSVSSIITAMLQAKGKVESQFFSIAVCLLYSYISYTNRYFGEVIFYMLVMFPMAIGGIISWMRHKSEKTNTVEVNEIKKKEWILIFIVSVIAFVVFYNLLKYFNTNELIVSTFSMIASFLAIYLLVRRSKYSFIFYLINDVILILLWIIPVLNGQLVLIPMIIEPLILFISDCYGTLNWNKMEEAQEES